MKKIIFTLIALFCFTYASAEFKPVTCDYTKTFIIHGLAFDQNLDEEVTGEEFGWFKDGSKALVRLKYHDFGSAGNYMYVEFSIGDDIVKTKYEDVLFLYNKEDNSYGVVDALGNNVLSISKIEGKQVMIAFDINVVVQQ